MSIGKALIDVRPLRASPPFRRLWIGTSLSTIAGQLAFVAVLCQAWEVTQNPIGPRCSSARRSAAS